MKELIHKIKSVIPLSSGGEEQVYKIAKERSFSKGDVLIREGQPVSKTYFVLKGCLRSYCIDKDGKEHTLQFAIKDWWISDFMAIYSGENSSLNVECISDSKVVEFKSKELDEILTLFPEFEVFQRRNLERHVVSLHRRILNQLQLSATERYELFMKEYPDIEQYAPNYHIASFLGITQQSLSRIRKDRSKKLS